jgi:hypothetical protein
MAQLNRVQDKVPWEPRVPVIPFPSVPRYVRLLRISQVY